MSNLICKECEREPVLEKETKEICRICGLEYTDISSPASPVCNLCAIKNQLCVSCGQPFHQDALELINTMEFVDDDADGENCACVSVEDNEINRDILFKIGFDGEYLEKQRLINDDGTINVAPIAFKYSDWWDGECFTDKEPTSCDDCGAEIIEILKNLAFVDLDESMTDRCESAGAVQELLRKLGHGEWVDAQIKQNEKDFNEWNS